MNEHSFIRAIHKHIKEDKKNCFVWKIHDPYAGGVPDAFYSGPKRHLFVEYKFIAHVPKRHETTIDLTKKHLSGNQAKWLHERYSHNIAVAVIIGSKTGVAVRPAISWRTPLTRDDLCNNATPKSIAKAIIEFCCTKKGQFTDGHTYLTQTENTAHPDNARQKH